MSEALKALENQIPAQDCEIEYWLQQAENYAEVQIPADDLRAIIARICGAALSPVGDGEIEAIRAIYQTARAARTACTPSAPESVWRAKDEAERNWDSLTDYMNPNGAVPSLLSRVDALAAELAAERERGERMREALFEIIGLDHHNMGPEGQATKLARAAMEGGA